jgi:hypothetical protein
MPANPAEAVAYFRISSAANVGGDSLARQRCSELLMQMRTQASVKRPWTDVRRCGGGRSQLASGSPGSSRFPVRCSATDCPW